MLAFIPLGAILGPAILFLAYQYHHEHGHLDNYLALSQLAFQPINILICFWELILCYNYAYITRAHERRLKDGFYKRAKQDPIVLFQDLSLSKVFSPDFWAYIWIDYCRFDPAYANKITFGYNIDVGNGHSTIIPSLFLTLSVVKPILDAKTTGIIAIIFNYQMFYGTVIYFYSYFTSSSERGYNKSRWHGLGVVIFANSFWIIFTLLGLYAGTRLIYDDSFEVYQ